MWRILGNFLALVALVFITGMHFAILQGVASARMVVDYSRNSSLAEGLSKTLDGAHPCAMCVKISKSRSEEKKKSETIGFSEKKSEAAILPSSTPFTARPFFSTGFESFSESARARSEQPALRPPRSV